jgi:serine/threonine protein kinase
VGSDIFLTEDVIMQDMLERQIGNYVIMAEIASGTFGSVYLAKHTILHDRSPVALKLLHTHLGSEKERERFFQEARFLDKLRHPHILPLEDTGLYEGFPYLVVEYAANGSLRDRLCQYPSQPLPIGEALTILSQIAQALQYAHDQKNIVHRDLKPANILFNANGEAVLADFGIAVVLEQTRRVEVEGTPPYMAPEQFQGEVSKKSDQYALGCIAYELLTGRRPFEAPNNYAMGYKHVHELPIPPTQLNPNLPKYVEQAILKAMAKQRKDRYSDISAFITALQISSYLQAKDGRMHQQTECQSSPNTVVLSKLQKISINTIDAEDVLKRVQQNDIPSTWHILQPSRLAILKNYVIIDMLLGLWLGVSVGILLGMLLFVIWIWTFFSSFPLSLILWSFVFSSVLGSLVGSLIGIFGLLKVERNRLVLTPEGFIYFDDYFNNKKTPRHIINYADVKDLGLTTFANQRLLAVETNLLSTQINLINFESPEIIAQSIDQACARFKISNNLSWAPERQVARLLDDELRKADELRKTNEKRLKEEERNRFF